MEFTPEQIRELARTIDLDIPPADLQNVALRLGSLLSSMALIERELGAQMDQTEPVPPVYPQEIFK